VTSNVAPPSSHHSPYKFLPRESHDSPYREHTKSKTATTRDRSASHHTKKSAHPKPHKAHAHQPAAAKSGRKRSGGGGRKRRRGSGKGPSAPREGLTSHPTSRNAFVETRAWLLRQHGPVCAYCGSKFAPRTMTLDHVAPRRGQTAYDRRDNLVLACRSCNEKKKDLAPLAFLLGLKSRAANLVRYGSHLSEGLLDLARSLIRPEEASPGALPPPEASSGASNIDHSRWGAPTEPDEDSPYRD
jgi:5-methylcytosine-specific restriction endonuclease McrA